VRKEKSLGKYQKMGQSGKNVFDFIEISIYNGRKRRKKTTFWGKRARGAENGSRDQRIYGVPVPRKAGFEKYADVLQAGSGPDGRVLERAGDRGDKEGDQDRAQFLHPLFGEPGAGRYHDFPYDGFHEGIFPL
jgi:hypothetical protein